MLAAARLAARQGRRSSAVTEARKNRSDDCSCPLGQKDHQLLIHGPLFAKIVIFRKGEKQPTHTRTISLRHQLLHTDAATRPSSSSQTARTDEVYMASSTSLGEPARPATVVVVGRLWQAETEKNAALVVKRGGIFEPPLQNKRNAVWLALVQHETFSSFTIFFPHPIYYLRPSFLSVVFFSFIPFVFALLFSLLPSRNSDPGSHCRLFSPPPHHGSCPSFFIVRRLQPFLSSSTRVELRLPTIGTLSS